MICNTYYYNTSQIEGTIQFPISMRIAPTIVCNSITNNFITRITAKTFGAVSQFNTSTQSTLIYAGTTGVTQYYSDALYSGASGSNLAWSAEL